MEPFEPDFEIIKMDAEVASYQEDFDPDEGRDPTGAAMGESPDDDASA